MERLRLAAAPLFFAYRRVRARPLAFAGVAAALGAAVALIGWSSLTAADANETSVRERLRELPPRMRAIQVVYFMLPGEADYRARPVAEALARFHDVGEPVRRLRISHSVEPGKPLGTRLVAAGDSGRDVRLLSGRLPHGCCEALALTAHVGVGEVARPAPGVRLRIVGRGSLVRGLASADDLGRKALLVPSFGGGIGRLVSAHGSTVVTTTFLDPKRVHAFGLGRLRERLRVTSGRLLQGDPLVRTSAPVGVLADLDRRGRIARERLLLVAGEGAALILAFAAFVATARRREADVADAQLTDLGAARSQRAVARAAELLIPGVAGTVLALAGVAIGALVVARQRGLPFAFLGAALPLGTTLVMAGVGLAGTLLLYGVVGGRGGGRTRFGAGAFELAALTALGLILWQSAVTGALDPDAVARSGAAPVILLVPALAFLAAAVLLLRLVPAALRLGQRLGRRRPLVRLAFVTAGRSPRQAAAATTFLAVAVGSSLFSVDYLATIDRQARDAAQFAVGATWRSASGGGGAPVLRMDGAVNETEPAGGQRAVRVLAVPAAELRHMIGWRDGFSKSSRSEIARRLRPTRIRLEGTALAPGATEVRVWARAQTDYPRLVVLHFLLPNQHFASVDLGAVFHRWTLLRGSVRGLAGGRLVAVEYEPTYTPISFKYDPKGFVDLGPIEQRGAGGWSALPSIGRWSPTISPDGRSGVLYPTTFRRAPVSAGTRFELSGTFQPLVHPAAGLPPPLPGFQVGALPALVGEPEAAQAVDGLLTLVVAGKAVPVRVVGRASLFPTISKRPRDFAVLDYDTLFAALNADRPGIATPKERWHFAGSAPTGAALSADAVEARLRADPLAAGTRTVLAVTAVVAALLGLIGLLVATGSAVRSERLALAEYEALGISPRSLGRSVQLRLVVLSAVGIAAGVAGGFASVRLVGALVAVTGTARRPLPPIVSIVDWTFATVVVAALCLGALLAARLIAARAAREPVARRLRA